ncbi:hypothetical protein CC86DRAFT_213084 [Ophiobolus disseminans]|uniref:Uncharacterized protein n=1 Tax=Ophiobolus disseminans TaxID=1469910 RepID=A0A6A7A4F4_9PLEO|nr:hypothetical protein CC86DRAFT_213084 [Ophiobolus disseminans]
MQFALRRLMRPRTLARLFAPIPCTVHFLLLFRPSRKPFLPKELHLYFSTAQLLSLFRTTSSHGSCMWPRRFVSSFKRSAMGRALQAFLLRLCIGRGFLSLGVRDGLAFVCIYHWMEWDVGYRSLCSGLGMGMAMAMKMDDHAIWTYCLCFSYMSKVPVASAVT